MVDIALNGCWMMMMMILDPLIDCLMVFSAFQGHLKSAEISNKRIVYIHIVYIGFFDLRLLALLARNNDSCFMCLEGLRRTCKESRASAVFRKLYYRNMEFDYVLNTSPCTICCTTDSVSLPCDKHIHECSLLLSLLILPNPMSGCHPRPSNDLGKKQKIQVIHL